MRTLLTPLLSVLLLAAGAFAQSIDEVKPACAAPGDAILLKGSGFSGSPAVHFGAAEAEILRSSESRIICRVPEGLAEGDVTVDADGAKASFHVLAEGAPAIVHVSAGTATPGMLVFFVGARLKGAEAAFVDGDDATVATVELKGGWRAAYLKVPGDLAPGTYTVVISNEAGDSGPCSPTLVVVEEGEPTLASIEPSEQLPGRPVLCKGTDLGPVGFCFLTWTDGDGNGLYTYGFTNGYDTIHTWVPWDAAAGATYDVTIDFADGSSTEGTGALAYTVGVPEPPEIVDLEYEEGPPGSLVTIFGTNLVGSGFAWPSVLFTRDGSSTEALVYYAFGSYPGGGLGGDPLHGNGGPNALQGLGGDGLDQILVEVPRSLEDGDYDVTVTVNGQTSDAKVFTVVDLPLTVTSMSPDSQGPWGPEGVVVIEGTGFGVPDFDFVIADGSAANGVAGDPSGVPFQPSFKVKVTWQKGGGDPLTGEVLWHHDREILVIPPGGWEHPLAVGTYTVYVTVEHDDESTETVEAGTYTVHEKQDDGGSNGFPGDPGGILRK
ncbi:MAG TPA: IPT/TIG domain-containing protein [Planctomycetota bacterium]|nr:IPT/TIG domain-containing protein [Planctomycetota bacterium]